MICSNCGKEIPDGASYCLDCGASCDEPVVISATKAKEAAAASKAKGKSEGPIFDLSGYVKALGADTSVLIGVLAAVLVYLAPFFSWIKKVHFDVKVTGNLFELGGKNSEMSVNSGIIIFFAILILLSAIDMLAFTGCKYIGPLKKFDKNYIIRALPILTTTLFFFLVINVEKYKTALNVLKEQEATAENLGASFNFSGGMGVGPVMLVAGVVLYAVSVALSYAKRNNNG